MTNKKADRIKKKLTKVTKDFAQTLKRHTLIDGIPTRKMIEEMEDLAKKQNVLAEEWNSLFPEHKMGLIEI